MKYEDLNSMKMKKLIKNLSFPAAIIVENPCIKIIHKSSKLRIIILQQAFYAVRQLNNKDSDQTV